IAAMAGRPRYLIVSATLPPYFSKEKFKHLYKAMVECARTYRTTIVGGDLTTGPCLHITVTALGDEHENGCILRSGAKAGDVSAVTGDFGASRAGLHLLTAGLSGDVESLRLSGSHCILKHLRPAPRLCESWALVRQTRGRAAMMDASDGLA